MEAAMYSNLNMRMGKREALAFYHQLRSYIRVKDSKSFCSLMELNSSTLKDDALMVLVIGIMKDKHPAALALFIHAQEQEASLAMLAGHLRLQP